MKPRTLPHLHWIGAIGLLMGACHGPDMDGMEQPSPRSVHEAEGATPPHKVSAPLVTPTPHARTCEDVEAASPEEWKPVDRVRWARAHRGGCADVAIAQYLQAMPDLSPEDQALGWNRLAYLYIDLNRDVGDAALDRAFSEGERTSRENNLACQQVRSLHTQLGLHLDRQRLADAEPVFERLEPILDACLEQAERQTDAEELMAAAFQLSRLRIKQENEAEGAEILRSMREKLSPDFDTVDIEMREEELRHDLGDVSDGGTAYRRLIARAQESKNSSEINLRMDLAYLLRDRGELAAAWYLIDETLRLERHADELKRLRDTLFLLSAWIAIDEGRFAAAEEALAAAGGALAAAGGALAAAGGALAARSSGEGAALESANGERRSMHALVRADLLLARGASARAREQFEALLGTDLPLEAEWRARLGLAGALRAEGQAAEALRILWVAVREVEDQRARTREHFWRLSYLGQRYRLYELWLDTLLEVWLTGDQALSSAFDRPERAFEQGRISAEDLLAAVEQVSAQNLVQQYRHDWGGGRSFARVLERVGILPTSAPGWTSGAALRRLILPDTPVLVYVPLPERMMILEVRTEGIRIAVVRISRTELEDLTDRALSTFERDPAGVPGELSRLGELLLEPVRARLPEDLQPVGFVLLAPLDRLPVAALRSQGRYLVQRVSPFVLPHLRLLERPDASPADVEGVSLAVHGSPDLPAAREELALVKARFRRTRTLSGEQATKEAVLAAMPDATHLHLATHSRQPEPLLGAHRRVLLDLPARFAVHEGEVAASDIVARPLRARLAVLASCRSQVGTRDAFDGSVGALNRAVLAAGASTTIASSWDVGDRVTYELMARFYQGNPLTERARRLGDAQRQLVASAERVRISVLRSEPGRQTGAQDGPLELEIPLNAPWSWAGFALTGRPD